MTWLKLKWNTCVTDRNCKYKIMCCIWISIHRWSYQFGFSTLSRKTDSSLMDAYCVHVRQWLWIAMFLFWRLSHDSSSSRISGTFKILTCPTERGQHSQFRKSKLHEDSAWSWSQSQLTNGTSGPDGCMLQSHPSVSDNQAHCGLTMCFPGLANGPGLM